MAESTLSTTGALKGRSRIRGVPVLMYHGIGSPRTGLIPKAERKYWIEESQFAAQLETIRSRECQVGLLRDLWWVRSLPGSFSPVAITFDDGHASDYSVALPLLLEFSFRADFFINTANVDSPGFLTWKQIGEMHKAGMSIQSHGHEHVDLSQLSPDALSRQLARSKSLIEDQLGCAVEFLSVPYGLVSSRIVDQALSEGYRAVCTSRPWPARMGEVEISRMAIHRQMSSRRFGSLLAGEIWPYAAASFRQALLYLPKQLLLRLNPAALTVRAPGEAQ